MKDRVIGGGLLVVGVAIVLILIYLFKWGGMQPKEAYEKIRDDLFPAYQKAEEEGDYVELRAVAQEIADTMDKGKAVPVKEYLKSDSISGSADAKRLYALSQEAAFHRNAKGEFEFKGDWYEARVHASLTELRDAIERRLKNLRAIREMAAEARAALADARLGSGAALTLPAAKVLPPEDIPIVDPNPVYASDTELYRVFGLPAEELAKALQVENPGGKSTSARLRWNQNVAPSDLGTRIESIPETIADFAQLGAKIHLNAKRLEREKDASRSLEKLMGEAASYIGGGLDAAHREPFRENRKRFMTGLAIKHVLERELKLLEPYLINVRGLGKTFRQPFVE